METIESIIDNYINGNIDDARQLMRGEDIEFYQLLDRYMEIEKMKFRVISFTRNMLK